jgi:hypothetical protein
MIKKKQDRMEYGFCIFVAKWGEAPLGSLVYETFLRASSFTSSVTFTNLEAIFCNFS